MADGTGGVVLVTGASGGIGQAIARELANRGYRLFLAARRRDALQALTDELGACAAFHVTDVSDRSSVAEMAEAAVARFGQIDALVNNAGIMPSSPLADGRVEDWERMIDVNFRGVLYAINAVLPGMLARGGGQIVNIASVAALKPSALGGVYAATKAAVRALSETLRLELAGRIQVTLITPGAVHTDLAEAIPDDKRREQLKAMIAQSALEPRAIAEATAYALAQPADVSVNEIVVRPTSAAQ
jgi:NADP-dependent 3-hydroxy acid dehydrogenase YdfG